MKRVLTLGILVVAGIAFVGLATGADEEQGLGEFRVELDNAFGLVEGGDFKVAGVTAGRITDLEVDKRTKRALVGFEVTETGFGSLRTDVRCEVMPQSLVGEYFINCEPGEKPEKLEPGSTIPVERTASTVPPDLVANIMRRPRRERLRLILNELGAAVAGNGKNLNDAIRRASPALRETNRVLALLADQNQVLADLARDADRVVGELADNRKDVTRWVVSARDIARTSAERDDDIARGFERLPTFLAELEPTMLELGRTAERQGPALQNLAASADQLKRLFENLPPFAEASRPALRALGEASVTGRRAMKPAQSTVRELNRYARGVPELGRNLAIILEHLDDRDNAIEADKRSPGGKGYTGLEALLQYTLDQTLAINMHDGNVHMLQVFAFESKCSPYADLSAVPELGEQCGRYLGPNALGIKTADPTAPADWDRNDRGPESSDPNNRRRTAPDDRDLATPRRAAGDDGAEREEGGDGDGARSRSAGEDAPVRMPSLENVLPGGGGAPETPDVAPPAVRSLPDVDVDAGTVAEREDDRQNEQLMDFLFGS